MGKAWSPVYLGDVLEEVERGRRIVSANHEDGNMPLVSSMGSNNGVTGFVGNTVGVRIFSDCMTVANGGASAGKCYFHPYSFVASDHVTHGARSGLGRDDYLGLSACTTKALTGKYSFSHEIKDEQLPRERVMLPIADDGAPDWEYMSSLSKSMRVGLLMRYREYLQGRLSLLRYKNIPALDEVEWGRVTLEDLFEIRPGKRLEKRNMTGGKRPFVGASDSNNGVTAFVSNSNESIDSNVLGINYNGSVCETFYHPYECIFSDDVKRLHLRDHEDNEAILLFLGRIIKQQKVKFEYAYKFNEQRMRRQTVLVPISDEGTPDYAYMEQYAKNMMLRKYQQYLDYLDVQDDADAQHQEGR